MKEAELKWSFEQGDFKKTMAFELAAKVKLGAGSFKVKGKISQGILPNGFYNKDI